MSGALAPGGPSFRAGAPVPCPAHTTTSSSAAGLPSRGCSAPLGASVGEGGGNFSLYGRQATAVELCLFDSVSNAVPSARVALDPDQQRTGDYWHCHMEGIGTGQHYGWRVEGPWQPQLGLRFERPICCSIPMGWPWRYRRVTAKPRAAAAPACRRSRPAPTPDPREHRQVIVETLAELGAKVILDYRSHPEATEELEPEIGSYGGASFGVQADASKLEDLQRLFEVAVAQYGKLDIMINNAGVETRTSVLDTTPEQCDKVLDINLRGIFFATQYAAKQMISQGGGGRIINISSVHEDWPMPNNTAYCLSKGGMRMLTRTVGLELAPHGITTVNVGPGAVATPINDSTLNNPEYWPN